MVIRLLIFVLMIFVFADCDRTDSDIKAQSSNLEGRWKLVSVEAIGNPNVQDTSWVYEDGFIEFSYSKKNDLAPISYSLTEGDTMLVTASLPKRGEIGFNYPTPEDYEEGRVALLYNHKIEIITLTQLTVTGTLSLKLSEKKYIHYGMSRIRFTK